MTPVTRPCSFDHSYELPLRRSLLLLGDILGLVRFGAWVLLDRLIGVSPCHGGEVLQLPGQPWGGDELVDTAEVERFLEEEATTFWAPTSSKAAGGTLSLEAQRYSRLRVAARPVDDDEDEDGEGAGVCAICLAGLEAGGCQVVAELCNCSHAFHAACIDAWVGTCPLCRAPMCPR